MFWESTRLKVSPSSPNRVRLQLSGAMVVSYWLIVGGRLHDYPPFPGELALF